MKSLFRDKPLDQDFVSKWIYKDNYRNPFLYLTIQIQWEAVTTISDIFDGIISIEVSLDGELISEAESFVIDSESNAGSCAMNLTIAPVQAYRLKFRKNSLQNGSMTVAYSYV